MNETTAIVLPSQFNLEEKSAELLQQGLSPIIADRDKMKVIYDSILSLDVESPQTAKMARELRLSLVKNRTQGIDKWHKSTKEFHLRAGQFIDAVRKRENAVNEYMEKQLQAIEDYQEKKREQEIQELFEARAAMLEPYREFVPILNYGTMKQEEFDKVYIAAKTTFEVKEKERIEIAEKTARFEARKNILAPYKDTKYVRELSDEYLYDYSDEEFDRVFKVVVHESLIEDLENDRRTEITKYQAYFKEPNEFDYPLGNLDNETYQAIIYRLQSRKEEQEQEKERLRLENERLRKQQEEERAEAKRKQDEADAKRREAEQKLLEEHRRRKKEEQEKRDAIRKREEEKERLRLAPVREGLEAWVDSFRILDYPGNENQTSKEIRTKFDSFKAWAKRIINEQYGRN